MEIYLHYSTLSNLQRQYSTFIENIFVFSIEHTSSLASDGRISQKVHTKNSFSDLAPKGLIGVGEFGRLILRRLNTTLAVWSPIDQKIHI